MSTNASFNDCDMSACAANPASICASTQAVLRSQVREWPAWTRAACEMKLQSWGGRKPGPSSLIGCPHIIRRPPKALRPCGRRRRTRRARGVRHGSSCIVRFAPDAPLFGSYSQLLLHSRKVTNALTRTKTNLRAGAPRGSGRPPRSQPRTQIRAGRSHR